MLEVAGVHWASEKAVAEAVLGRRPGVLQVDANPVGQTATVTYDPAQTSVAQLSGWVRDCGYHCAGQSVPQHTTWSPVSWREQARLEMTPHAVAVDTAGTRIAVVTEDALWESTDGGRTFTPVLGA